MRSGVLLLLDKEGDGEVLLVQAPLSVEEIVWEGTSPRLSMNMIKQ
jgi:hypothetical protein